MTKLKQRQASYTGRTIRIKFSLQDLFWLMLFVSRARITETLEHDKARTLKRLVDFFEANNCYKRFESSLDIDAKGWNEPMKTHDLKEED